MSLPKADVQGSLFDVPVLAAALFKSKTQRYRIFREKILPRLRQSREKLAALYCEENGRPGIEPVLMQGVTLLQFMEKAPDRKAEENVKLHLGWKYALDLPIDYEGFDHSSLGRFRQRLEQQEAAERIGFDALLEGLRQDGLVKKRGKQRLDSTHVLGAVAKMSRAEVVRETIRGFLLDVKAAGFHSRLDQWELMRERYLESEIAWHRIAKEGLIAKNRQAGLDALELIRWLRLQPACIRDSQKALLLERVFLEQYEMEALEPHSRKEEASGVVKNPHDPDVQWASKDKAKTKQWEGYKVQIAETVAENGLAKEKGEPTEQFITEVTTMPAISSDLAGRRKMEENQREHGLGVADELNADGAYITGEMLAQAREQGRELIGPAQRSTNSSGKNLFDADAFHVSVAQRKAICPAGHESTQCTRLENEQTGRVRYRFEWASLCDQCELNSQCTKSQNGRRLLRVGQYYDDIQQRRREMKTDEFKKRMQQRNGIEGTISEFTRGGGRRTRYRGLSKTSLANYFHGAAINANRWIRLVQWQEEMKIRAA